MEYINRFYWLIALCLIISTGANASVNPKPFVIPELKEWKGSDGTFVPTEATKIVYAANNPELERIARIFAQDYQTMFGRSLEVVQGKGAAGEPWRICLSVWIYLSLCVRPQLSWIY
mgnify:FL=1